jgi:hypothetical protein
MKFSRDLQTDSSIIYPHHSPYKHSFSPPRSNPINQSYDDIANDEEPNESDNSFDIPKQSPVAKIFSNLDKQMEQTKMIAPLKKKDQTRRIKKKDVMLSPLRNPLQDIKPKRSLKKKSSPIRTRTSISPLRDPLVHIKNKTKSLPKQILLEETTSTEKTEDSKIDIPTDILELIKKSSPKKKNKINKMDSKNKYHHRNRNSIASSERNLKTKAFNKKYDIIDGSYEWPGSYLDNGKHKIPCYYYNKKALERACRVRNIKLSYSDPRDGKNRPKTKARLCEDLEKFGIKFSTNYNIPEWFNSHTYPKNSTSLYNRAKMGYENKYTKFKKEKKAFVDKYKKKTGIDKFSLYTPIKTNSNPTAGSIYSKLYNASLKNNNKKNI